MKQNMGSEQRQKTKIIRVRVTPEEWNEIESLAATCSLSIPEFMRRMTLSYKPKSTLDAQAITELAKINTDMGRIAGLLKLWISIDSKKADAFNYDIPKLITELKSLKTKATEALDKI